jgi:hypothetical protein
MQASTCDVVKSCIILGSMLGTLINFPLIGWGQEPAALSPGLYQLDMIFASTTRIPFFGSSKSASRSISLVEIRSNDGTLVQSHKVCDFRVLEDSAMIKMIFPEKFIAALANHTYPIRLQHDGQGWRYRADLGVERIGYKAGDRESKVPERIDDPAVYDWDGDGQPAATLKLSVPLLPDGELYVVQRGHSILNGRIVGSGTIEGSIEYAAFEQRVLGARPSFLNQSPEITPDPKESRFVMTPLAEGSNCDTIRKSHMAVKSNDSTR